MTMTNLVLLDLYKSTHSDISSVIDKWVHATEEATWKNHNELKSNYPSADYIGNGRYVFNLKGNKYRLIVLVVFVAGIMDIRFIGSHADYDKIKDCSKI